MKRQQSLLLFDMPSQHGAIVRRARFGLGDPVPDGTVEKVSINTDVPGMLRGALSSANMTGLHRDVVIAVDPGDHVYPNQLGDSFSIVGQLNSEFATGDQRFHVRTHDRDTLAAIGVARNLFGSGGTSAATGDGTQGPLAVVVLRGGRARIVMAPEPRDGMWDIDLVDSHSLEQSERADRDGACHFRPYVNDLMLHELLKAEGLEWRLGQRGDVSKEVAQCCGPLLAPDVRILMQRSASVEQEPTHGPAYWEDGMHDTLQPTPGVRPIHHEGEGCPLCAQGVIFTPASFSRTAESWLGLHTRLADATDHVPGHHGYGCGACALVERLTIRLSVRAARLIVEAGGRAAFVMEGDSMRTSANEMDALLAEDAGDGIELHSYGGVMNDAVWNGASAVVYG